MVVPAIWAILQNWNMNLPRQAVIFYPESLTRKIVLYVCSVKNLSILKLYPFSVSHSDCCTFVLVSILSKWCGILMGFIFFNCDIAKMLQYLKANTAKNFLFWFSTKVYNTQITDKSYHFSRHDICAKFRLDNIVRLYNIL